MIRLTLRHLFNVPYSVYKQVAHRFNSLYNIQSLFFVAFLSYDSALPGQIWVFWVSLAIAEIQCCGKPTAASAEPTEPVVPQRVPGAAGTAETGVVRVGAKSGVNYQLAVGELGLVHALWRHINTCNRHRCLKYLPHKISSIKHRLLCVLWVMRFIMPDCFYSFSLLISHLHGTDLSFSTSFCLKKIHHFTENINSSTHRIIKLSNWQFNLINRPETHFLNWCQNQNLNSFF